MCTKKRDFNIRQLVLNGEPEIREKYIRSYKKEIDKFIGLAHNAYEEQVRINEKLPIEVRAAWVENFLYQALNNIITSFHLFISGYNVPSDHLMRQFFEGIATALLFSHAGIKVYENFINEKERFSFHKTLSMVNRKDNMALLEINKDKWEDFMKIAGFFDPISHASVVTACMVVHFSEPGLRVMGASFDLDKKEYYYKSIKFRQSALQFHISIVKHITERYI